MIQVTKPFLPPLALYNSYVEKIWDNNWLTNNGPLLNELELKLKEFLGLEHLLFLGNGTIAIQIAIKALKLKGEIITTPFSYVATSSSIVWEGCKPVFVDINKEDYNINADLIEQSITKKTSAILCTHVFGNPCDIDKIRAIADKHKIKVIYDAAHCFGSKYKGQSVLSFGDVSTLSCHATKLFHTTEGGAIVTNDADLLKDMAFCRNFGHNGPAKFSGAGINGKNSEFHAAMGLANLTFIEEIMARRKEQYLYYQEKLKNLDAQWLTINQDAEFNYAYLPLVFKSEKYLLKVIEELNHQYIHPRRYFYPSLNKLEYVNGEDCPVSESISKRVICLPLYHDLTKESIDMICRILLRTQRYL